MKRRIESATAVPVTLPRRGRLGWWHAFWRRLLLAGLPALPATVPLPEGPPAAVRALASRLEHERGRFATAARTFGADYKGGYWMMYLLAPMAVTCAAAAAAGLASPRLMTGIELCLICLILLLFLLMRRQDWQERWIRARRTAEHLRYLPLVAPFVPDKHANWYEVLAARRGVRVMVDEEVTRVCLRLAQLEVAQQLNIGDREFVRDYVAYVKELLSQQIRYHSQKAALEHALSHRISLTSTAFFTITVGCTVALFLENLSGFTRPAQYLRLLATVLPALGGGLRGLLAQGESHRVAALSEGMVVRLGQLLQQLEALPLNGSYNEELEKIIWNTVQELLSEADTWMRLQESAPLSVAA